MSKDYSILDELAPKTQELHRAIFDKGYEQGCNEGFNNGRAQGRTEGLFEAWECARKIVADMVEPHFKSGYMVDMFGCESAITAMKNNSASEAVKRVKAWEEKQKADSEIKVGDEVVDGEAFNSVKGIVTFVSPIILYILWYDGSTGRRKLTDVKKTGRTFPKIAEVLEQLKEAEDETD